MTCISVDNLTNPGADPVHGDRVRYTYANGKTEIKMWLALPADVVDVSTIPLTRYGWMRLFTLGELVAIKELAKTDTVTDVFLEMLSAAEEIFLGDPSTIAALDYLQAQGLITAERRGQIESMEYQVSTLE